MSAILAKIVSSPTEALADKLRNSYSKTPNFAQPRMPAEFLFTIGDSLETYDIKSDRWTELDLKLPHGLSYSATESVGSKVFICVA